MNVLPEVALVCESSWSSQGHTYLQAFLSCPAQLCLFYSCSFTPDPLSSFWKHSSYLSCIWKCVGAVSYLPCISKEFLRTGFRMAPETSVCARVEKIQYLSFSSQQCAVNCSSLLPPAGSCPRALHSLLVLEPCATANMFLLGAEVSSSWGEELQAPGDHDDEVRYWSAVPCPGSCYGVLWLEMVKSCWSQGLQRNVYLHSPLPCHSGCIIDVPMLRTWESSCCRWQRCPLWSW